MNGILDLCGLDPLTEVYIPAKDRVVDNVVVRTSGAGWSCAMGWEVYAVCLGAVVVSSC